MREPRYEQTTIDIDDTEALPGGIPAGAEPALAARWAYYASLRAEHDDPGCIPEQLIHCFKHVLARTCICGRVQAGR